MYGSSPIQAWGGPGKGTVEMQANDYDTYLPTPNHPGFHLNLLARRKISLNSFLKQ